MHFKTKLALAVLLGLVPPTSNSQVDHSPRPALGIQYQIEQDFSFHHRLSQKELDLISFGAILKANPKSEGLTPNEAVTISSDVVRVARCLGVDPVILTALIWRESNFKPSSVSETGAVGLTQMTGTGIQEVLERTRFKGFRKLKYMSSLFKKCAPTVYASLPSTADPIALAKVKTRIAKRTYDSIVFGALLLKLNLASVYYIDNRIEKYRIALERYNGDPRIKTLFARDVLTLSKRMVALPEVALNDSRFLRQNPEL